MTKMTTLSRSTGEKKLILFVLYALEMQAYALYYMYEDKQCCSQNRIKKKKHRSCRENMGLVLRAQAIHAQTPETLFAPCNSVKDFSYIHSFLGTNFRLCPQLRRLTIRNRTPKYK